MMKENDVLIIYYAETDRDENTVTIEQRKGVCRMCNGSGEKTMTNADRIRAMSDEELAEWMAECNAYKENADASQWLPWLKQPVEEDNG